MTINATSYNPTLSAIAGSDLLGSQNFDPDSMTPDALILYLSTRLNNVDGQMDGIFAREKAAEGVRNEVRAIQELLTGLPVSTDKNVVITLTEPDDIAKLAAIDTHLSNIASIDPGLANKMREHLHGAGQICYVDDAAYSTLELDGSKDYLSMVSKDLESGSQMDMIALQSLMGARQTAIQLATNLVSALSESQKAIVSNIG